MWVRDVRLTDFRSYPDVQFQLTPGITTFIGANGQGKTNLVEAIGYVATLSSHRVASDGPMVRRDCERAYVCVEVMVDERPSLIEIEINPGRANRARLNRSPVRRPREVLGILRTVVFAPEDLSLVKGDPSDRRRFLDDLLTQRTPRMQGVRADYERILKQRNALLKSASVARRASPDDVARTLEVWDEQLAAMGSEIAAARVALLHDIRPHLAESYAWIAGGLDAVSATELQIGYVSGVGGPETARETPGSGSTVIDSTDREEWRQALLDAIARRRRDELDRGITLVGPHRDDMSITLGDGPAKGYASHGESWSIALALRLASLDVLTDGGDSPVLILDDVFAELDTARRRRLAERIAGTGQVLITAAVVDDVPGELVGRRIRVTRGAIDDE